HAAELRQDGCELERHDDAPGPVEARAVVAVLKRLRDRRVHQEARSAVIEIPERVEGEQLPVLSHQALLGLVIRRNSISATACCRVSVMDFAGAAHATWMRFAPTGCAATAPGSLKPPPSK